MAADIERDLYYSGVFNVFGEEIGGELIYNKSKGVILLNLVKSISDHSAFEKTFGDAHIITGILNSGTIVTLFHNRCTKNHFQGFKTRQLNYVADYMVWSKKEVTNTKFNKIICILENALNWSGLSGVDVTDDFEIKVKHNNYDEVYNWFGAKIKFSVDLECGLFSFPRNEETKITERLIVEIEASRKQDITYFTSVRDKIISLISFAIKDNVNIEKQYLIDYEDSYAINENITNYYKHSLFTSESYLPMRKSRFTEYNFVLRQTPPSKDISDELTRLEPVFNLYLSLFKYHHMPKEMVFLNIVQALETFHARFFYDDKKKYVASVMKRFGNRADFVSFEKLLLCDTQKDENCNFIILVSRLNDLFIGKNDGLFYDYYGTNPQYAQTIADTRHYYTHYGKSKESKALKDDDLLYAISVLALLLEYHVCLILGIDNSEKIKKRLN